MPELALSPAAAAVELMNHLLQEGDLTRLPDGRLMVSLIADPDILDRLFEWVDGTEDLEPIEDPEPSIGWPEDGGAVMGCGGDHGLCIADECEAEPREEDDPPEDDDPNGDIADDEDEIGEDDARDLPELGADGRPIPPRRFANAVRGVITERGRVVSLTHHRQSLARSGRRAIL